MQCRQSARRRFFVEHLYKPLLKFRRDLLRRQVGGRGVAGMRLRAMAAGRLRRIRLILVAALLSTGASPAVARAQSPQVSVGPIQTLAHVPYPGNPGAVAIDGDTMWVDSSSANFDRPF